MTDANPAASAAAIPLVTDLDDTLLKTDTLWEGAVALLAEHPLALFSFPGWLRQGKSTFKARLARVCAENIASYPVNEEVLTRLEQAANEGRPVYLATASHREVAEAAAMRFGLFSGVFASDDTINLKGEAKANLLTEKFGEKGFDYIGDSMADVPVWRIARRAICVARDEKTRRTALAAGADCEFLDCPPVLPSISVANDSANQGIAPPPPPPPSGVHRLPARFADAAMGEKLAGLRANVPGPHLYHCGFFPFSCCLYRLLLLRLGHLYRQ